MSEYEIGDQPGLVVARVDGTERVVDLNAGRRAFIRGLGLAAAGAGAGMLGSVGSAPEAKAQAGGLTDFDILNFALNLEYLEAEFYLQAAFGRGLADRDTTGRGRRGPVRGGSQVNFATKAIRLYAEEIAVDEENHVQFLRSALGSNAVARPFIDIGGAFNVAARAAGLTSGNESFRPFGSETNFLLSAFVFEDVGVTAYKGAAPLISDPAILSAAAGLLGVEAYHAGLVRTLLFARELFAPADAISDLRDSVEGRRSLDQGVGNANNANIVPTDRNSLIFGRTPAQVLSIVYLGGSGSGGFFPNGVNS